MSAQNGVAMPLHVQRLQRALDMTGFLSQMRRTAQPLGSASEWEQLPGDLSTTLTELVEETSDGDTNDSEPDISLPTDDEEWPLWLDGAGLSRSRRLLASDLLYSGSSDSEDGDSEQHSAADEQLQVARLLQQHQRRRTISRQCHTLPELPTSHLYYSAGLLSEVDRHPAASLTPGSAEHEGLPRLDVDPELDPVPVGEDGDGQRPLVSTPSAVRKRPPASAVYTAGASAAAEKRSKKPLKQQRDHIKSLNAQRRKLWLYIAKKEIGKVQRSMVNGRKDKVVILRRLAAGCTRAARQRALQSQKCEREVVWRMKRLTREMQTYWKHYSRVEKEARRRLEKEEMEQRRISSELLEAKRQQRKLNFLITQTELYAHFMQPKVAAAAGQDTILGQLDEVQSDARLAQLDDYDCDAAKSLALEHARAAVQRARQQTRGFERTRQSAPGVAGADKSASGAAAAADQSAPGAAAAGQSATGAAAADKSATGAVAAADQSAAGATAADQSAAEYRQPALFQGQLKEYQLKGMRWIANLFDSGINGILADEMGLGKTVQTIAFLAHLAEHYGIWGPFLVVGPASTLHNWQQELARFCPAFKVVPYWGNPQDRKVLRQFWEQANLATRAASFHLVITSYQLVVADAKYFSRIDWQCLVLDEAQAIKSTSSQRWRSLLGLRCRSRVLLTGTPIQNSMAELWALLHFIMPALFDSHREFSDWFSKDIENKAEHGGDIDQVHLSRLHMILKPFMLRRVKCDVENELSDKIEVMVYCPLTIRQRLLYQGLKRKISIDELLRSALGGTQQSQATTRLLNLVMQFRKVCNHPELFERRPMHWPVRLALPEFRLPRLVFREGLLHRALPSRAHLLYSRFCVMRPDRVHRCLVDHTSLTDAGLAVCRSGFSFLRFCDTSPAELHALVQSLQLRWQLLAAAVAARRRRQQAFAAGAASDVSSSSRRLLLVTDCSRLARPSQLLFTAHTSQFYAHLPHRILSRPETLEHRLLRSRSMNPAPPPAGAVASDTEPAASVADNAAAAGVGKLTAEEQGVELVPEFQHQPLPPQQLPLQPTDLPAFLQLLPRKVVAPPVGIYCSDRSAAWWWLDHLSCGSVTGKECLMHGSPEAAQEWRQQHHQLSAQEPGGVTALRPPHGWSPLIIPEKRTLIADAGKLYVLDPLLRRLKEGGHRVLIYSQMTRMIDLLEEYMFYRQHKYKRLDGSSKIHERRDMVDDFQTKSDIFVFLLSTRAGGLGINLTAADTVIFYDSDWNPTVDQQAMDRAHRLGQTKQVTVYRLICKGTIEERILQRAREKSEIQRMVIQGGSFRPDQLKAKEVVSLLLDDDVIEKKFRACQAESQSQQRKRRLEEPAVDVRSGPSSCDEKRVRSTEPEQTRRSRPQSRASQMSGDVAAREDTSPEGSLLLGRSRTPQLLPSPSDPEPFMELHVARSRRPAAAGVRRRGRPRGSTARGRSQVQMGRARAHAHAAAAGETSSGGPASDAPAASADTHNAPAEVQRRRGRGRSCRGTRSTSGRGTRGTSGRGRGRPPGSASRRPISLPVPLASSRYFQEQHQLERSATGSAAFNFYTPTDS